MCSREAQLEEIDFGNMVLYCKYSMQNELNYTINKEYRNVYIQDKYQEL